MKKKLVSLLLAICLVVGLLPTAAFAAGTETGKVIQLVDNGTAANMDGWDSTNGYNYIYYGTWKDSPIKWRVLDDQTNTGERGLFLLSEELLGTGTDGGVYFKQDGSSNAWQGSDAQAWCKDFAGIDGNSVTDAFSAAELAAILETTKDDAAYSDFAASDNILNGDRVFFMSAEEAENSEYGFINDAARVANYGDNSGVWWLRSPAADDTDLVAGVVSGCVSGNRVYDGCAARPAFNLDLNSVLFTSAARNGKPDGGLQAIPSQPQTVWTVGQWDFNDTSDSSGNGNTLTTNGLVSFNNGRMETQEGQFGNASVNLKLNGGVGFSLSVSFSTIRAGGTGVGAQTELFKFGSLTAVAYITGELEVTLNGESVGSAVGAVRDGDTNVLEVRIETDNALHVILNGNDIGSIANADVGGEGPLVIGSCSKFAYATSFDYVKIKDGSINECKLTLLDDSRNFNVTEMTDIGKPGGTVTLSYSGATTGANEYISAILADNSGAQYYGRILQPTNTSGEVSLKIPNTLVDGTYTLYVFSEQYNGDYKTDYASAFEEIALTVSCDSTAPTLNNGSATRDSETAATVTFTSDEAGNYYYEVVESGAAVPTIDTTRMGTSCDTTEQTFSLNNLLGNGAKDIYIVVKDAVGNVSQPLKIGIPAHSPPYVPPTKTLSQLAIEKIRAAKPGDTVELTPSAGQTNQLDKEVFEELQGKDITLKVNLSGGVSWTVNGKDIPENATLTDIVLGVSMNTSTIPVDLINMVTGEKGAVQITLAHNGEFGFTMTLTAPLGVENKGLWANLYHYDTTRKQILFETAARVDASGNVALKLSHASEYAIVLDTKSHELPFTDTTKGAWYQGAVEYVYHNGIMTGTSATTFEPNTTLSRAMVAQILYNLEGQPDISKENLGYPYSDVDAEAWYGDAVYWARINGVATGYEDNTFRPNRAVTREELAQMLYNYAKYKEIILPAVGDLSKFSDGDKVSSWAQTAMKWATGLQVINGYEDNTLRPGGNTTRAEAASMILGMVTTLMK